MKHMHQHRLFYTRFGKFFIAIFGVLMLLLYFIAWFITGGWGVFDYFPRSYQVKYGVAELVEEFPQTNQLDLLYTNTTYFSSHEHVPKLIQKELRREGRKPCFYARVFQVYGSHTPLSDVLSYLSVNLEPSGWESMGGHYLRGNNESIKVTYTGPSGFYTYGESGIDYDEMSRLYSELISIQIEYVWPKRSECY